MCIYQDFITQDTPQTADYVSMKTAPINLQQFEATNPTSSCWVTASAGTGKTKMLIDRLLRLLLSGADPRRILCITYTKAAANEMTERLHTTLQKWSTMSLDELEKTLATLQQKDASAEQVEQAKHLFYKLMENPLTVQTIHSFCQRILAQFPLEAGILPQSQVLDEPSSRKLKENAINHILQSESHNELLTTLSAFISESHLKDSLISAFSMISKMHAHAKENRRSFFQHNAHDIALSGADGDAIYTMAVLIQQFGPKLLRTMAKPIVDNRGTEEDLFSLFLTTKGTPRVKKSTKELLKECPPFNEQFEAMAQKLSLIREQRQIENVFILNEAFDTLFVEVQRVYTIEKKRLGVMDFDDLITKAVTLIQSDQAWIMHKLDGGFDHILIDEAQDTSPTQWAIIKALTTHFFEVPALNQMPRTLFVVGDGKQSIYSFQGADPHMYSDVKKHFELLLHENSLTLHTIPLTTCYRCAPEILSLVDTVCADSAIAPSLLHDGVITHISHRPPHQSAVVAWPLVGSCVMEEDIDEQDSSAKGNQEYLGWHLYPTPLLLPSPEEELAKNIAAHIHNILEKGDILPSTGNPVEAKDIYILLKRRGKLMALIGSTLTQLGIANTCQDQSAFLAHLYVKDFLAFLTFLDCPYDDLNLACLLKSPVLGMGEDDLLRLCYERKQPLWDVLQQSFKHKNHTQFLNYFITLLSSHDLHTIVYTYLHKTLDRNQSIFGEEVLGLMESLIDITLTGTMSRPMTPLDLRQYIIDQAPLLKKHVRSEGVQIMTIHGSKGLQAPIVILGDAGERPISTYDKILCTDDFHILRQDYQTLQSIKDLEKNTLNAENHRLLYVALTRAQDRLYITGINRGITDSWYNILLPHVVKNDNLPHVEPIAVIHDGIESTDTIAIKSYEQPTRSLTPLQKEAMRGIQIHKLLELIATHDANAEFAHSAFKDLTQDVIESLKTLYHEKLAPLLMGMTPFQELSIKAMNGSLYRLDCVAFSNDKIMIIDFKTGTKKDEGAPITQGYISQINSYAATLHAMYPAHRIEGILVYTQCHNIVRWTCAVEDRAISLQ